MRAAKQSATGGVGIAEVSGLFERIGWAPVETQDRHDLGTDLLVAARDPRRFDRGLLVGVQVKAGESWFGEPQIEGNEGIKGWWHRNDNLHFDFWVKHQLPHILVLYDLDARKGHWVHVTPDRCVSTGKGVKILVPKTNTIDESDAARLLDVAVMQRGSISLEGTAFDAASTSIPPGDRLRFALLLPRLVAPHVNKSKPEVLEPEEAVALLVLLHIRRLQSLLENGTPWASLDEKPTTSDWRWHFAHALWMFISKNEVEQIQALLDASRKGSFRSDWRTVAAICLASAQLLNGQKEDAAAIIDLELDADHAEPVDHAWLRLHAAHVATERGQHDVARRHVGSAIEDLAVAVDDPSASLLSGIAYRIIFHLNSWQDNADSISATLRSGDNAGSWWRDQQLRWALDATALSSFREWAKDKSSRWEAEPPAQQLMPSTFMALFSADRAGWCAAESRLGRYEVQNATNATAFRGGFLRLLRSGDTQSMLMAGRRALMFGPADAISQLSEICVPKYFSPSLTQTMLEFWREFGDVGHVSAADEIVRWCMYRLIHNQANESATDKVLRESSLLDGVHPRFHGHLREGRFRP